MIRTVVFAFLLFFVLIACVQSERQNLSRKRVPRAIVNKYFDPPKSKKTVTYIRASIPIRIFRCIQKLNILRCMKLFLLQRMENPINIPNSGNLTKDFLDKILGHNDRYPSLIDKKYSQINESELTNRLIKSFQEFFKDRDIKLHFIPGVMVKIVPSNENIINVSMKKSRVRSRGHKPYHTMMQIGVPILMMPALILGSFLPFMLPALKMATLMSTLMNNGALLAAIMYAARTAVLSNDSEAVHYSHPGYH